MSMVLVTRQQQSRALVRLGLTCEMTQSVRCIAISQVTGLHVELACKGRFGPFSEIFGPLSSRTQNV